MAVELVIPKLGMSMKDAKIVEWKVAEGERVEAKQAVLVIETAKVTYEVQAPAAGFLHIVATPGTVVPVAGVTALVAESEEELARLQAERPAAAASAGGGATKPAEAAPAAKAGRPGRVKVSPAARKIAEVHGLDLAGIAGTGPEGRIVREDVERALEAREKGAASAPPTPAAAPEGEVLDGKRVATTLPVAGMRQAIAEHMHRSLAVSAQLTTMGEIDVSELMRLREKLVEKEATVGARVTFTDLFVFAAAKALRRHPIVNSSLVEDRIVVWDDVNVGVAVALEQGIAGGLIVPVVRNADRKPLGQLSREIRDLAERARDGRLLPDDLAGGTFTVTNLGAFGGGYGFGTPIISQPESAILGTGAITERPVVRGGEIVIRPIMTFSFTFDHRVIDGAPAGRFIGTLVELLENPQLLLA